MGSKYRILDFIEETVDKIDGSKGRVCDLFAGSCSVAFKLAHSRPVIAADVQEYSRVIGSALLLASPKPPDNIAAAFRSLERISELNHAIKPLVDYEENCLKQAVEKNVLPLCDLIEHGSVIAYQLQGSKASDELSTLLSDTIKRLKKANLFDGTQALAVKYFGGLYFSYHQASQIDSILYYISEVADQPVQNLLLASLLSTVSEAVNTVGKQFAQPLRAYNSDGHPKSGVAKAAFKDRTKDLFREFEKWVRRYSDVPSFSHSNLVRRSDYIETLDHLPSDTSLIYADPPYTRDHYSRFYHVLETLCLRDNPSVSKNTANGVTQISRGIYRSERHQSPFCIKSQAPVAFENLFKKSLQSDCQLLVSYSPFDESKKSHPRLLTLTDLLALAKKYYRNVEILSPGKFSHSKLNHSDKHLHSSDEAEVLIACLL
nr:DNA adenine methylase [Terrimonas ginsenosidimutans]